MSKQKFAKYGEKTAQLLARKILTTLGPQIDSACAGTPIKPEWVAGLVGMEDPQLYAWPSLRSTRFESGVFAKLKAVQSLVKFWAKGYNGITRDLLKGLPEPVLRNLATSWGYTQIMGYYCLTLFKGRSIEELRSPAQHFTFTVKMLREVAAKWIPDGRFDQMAHIWNAGHPYDVRNGVPHYTTYSPYYVYNCLLVAKAYQDLRISMTSEILAQAVSAAGPNLDPALSLSTQGELLPMSSQRASDTVGLLDPDNYAEQPAVQVETVQGLTAQAVKPGWQTSEGQMTALFGIIATVLSFVGLHYSPAQVQTTSDAVYHLIQSIGPIAAFIPVLFNYITSRGKTKSNSINAAAVAQAGMPVLAEQSFGGTLGGLLSGKDWKDPKRYLGLAKIVGSVAGGPVGDIIDTVTGDTAAAARAETIDPDEVRQAFALVAQRLKVIEDRLRAIDEAEVRVHADSAVSPDNFQG